MSEQEFYLSDYAAINSALTAISALKPSENLVLKIEIVKDVRTLKQNNALHKFFRNLAKHLNDAGLDMRKVLKPEVEIPWSIDSIKEHLWKPIQRIVVGHDKTSKLKAAEVDAVYRVLMRHLSDSKNVYLEFPSAR